MRLPLKLFKKYYVTGGDILDRGIKGVRILIDILLQLAVLLLTNKLQI